MAEKSRQKYRFLAVGALNTLIDFSLFALLFWLLKMALFATFVSTTTALLFSFVANKNYTFQSARSRNRRQFIKFLVVTIIGLWLLHPAIILLAQNFLTGDTVSAQTSAMVGKGIAIAMTMVWNYTLYSRFVFKTPREM